MSDIVFGGWSDTWRTDLGYASVRSPGIRPPPQTISYTYRRYRKKRCPEAWDKYMQVRNAVASHLKKANSLFVLNRQADASSHVNDLPGNPEESNC